MRTGYALIALLLCAGLLGCTGTYNGRPVRTSVHYRTGWGPGPYWGWGYSRPIIIAPGPDLPDLGRPEAVPLPEPPPDFGAPDMGMPDFGDMDMGGMDMGGMDMGGFDF
jgi:hypothetical protein